MKHILHYSKYKSRNGNAGKDVREGHEHRLIGSNKVFSIGDTVIVVAISSEIAAAYEIIEKVTSPDSLPDFWMPFWKHLYRVDPLTDIVATGGKGCPLREAIYTHRDPDEAINLMTTKLYVTCDSESSDDDDDL